MLKFIQSLSYDNNIPIIDIIAIIILWAELTVTVLQVLKLWIQREVFYWSYKMCMLLSKHPNIMVLKITLCSRYYNTEKFLFNIDYCDT